MQPLDLKAMAPVGRPHGNDVLAEHVAVRLHVEGFSRREAPRACPDRRTSAAIRDAARRPTPANAGLSTRSAAASTPSASSAPSVTSAACKASAHHPSRRCRPSRTSSLSSPKGAQANWRLAACSATDATFGSTYSNWEATAKHTSARANSSELKGVFMGDTSKKKGRGTGQIGREGGVNLSGARLNVGLYRIGEHSSRYWKGS